MKIKAYSNTALLAIATVCSVLAIFSLIVFKLSFLSQFYAILLGIPALGAMGYFLGELGRRWAIKKDPEDERNLSISAIAKGKSFDLMNHVFGGLIVIYALLKADTHLLLLLMGAYLISFGGMIYHLVKLHNTM